MARVIKPCVVFVFILLLYEPNLVSVSGAAINGNDLETQKDSLVMPAMARKAGGSWKPELIEDTKSVETMEGDTKEGSTGDTEEDYYWESDEEDCPKRYYFHVRGRKCVPLKCYGGNQYRDQETGECAPKWLVDRESQGYGYYYGNYNRRRVLHRTEWRRRPWSRFGRRLT